MRNKGRQAYSVVTVNGRVRLRRVRWHTPQETSTPMDVLLDEAEATLTRGVIELACRLNQCSSSFEKTSQNLLRAAQISLCKETLRQVVESEGKAVLSAARRGTLVADWTAKECTTAEGASRVYLGCDGVKVPTITDAEKQLRRKRVREKRRRRGRRCRPLPPAKRGSDNAYKEFKIVIFYDESQTHSQVSVTRGNHEAAGHLMRREADRLKLHEADDKIANVDGADWIRRQIEQRGLCVDRIGLDFFHLSENVHKARRAVFGDKDETGHTWAGELMHTFKHKGYQAAWQQLVDWRGSLRSPKKRKAADRLINYVVERRSMIHYPEFLENGWQIGSGPTEAQCKTTTRRVKGSGRRWDNANAEALMALAALDNSHQWKPYWQLN